MYLLALKAPHFMKMANTVEFQLDEMVMDLFVILEDHSLLLTRICVLFREEPWHNEDSQNTKLDRILSWCCMKKITLKINETTSV